MIGVMGWYGSWGGSLGEEVCKCMFVSVCDHLLLFAMHQAKKSAIEEKLRFTGL